MNIHVAREPDGYSFRVAVIDAPTERLAEIRHLNSSQLFDFVQALKVVSLAAVREKDELFYEVSAEDMSESEMARTLLLGLPEEIQSLITRHPPEG